MKKFLSFLAVFFFVLSTTYAQKILDSIDVEHYDIHLLIDLNHKFIQGHSTAKLTSDYDLNRIGLNLWGLFIDSIFIDNQKITNFNYNSKTIFINYPLKQHDTINLTIFYHGNPHHEQDWGGFYFSKTDAFNYGIGLTSTPPGLARAWFPANDLFTDKATFDFHIIVDTGLTAVCNGKLVDVTDTTVFKHLKTKILDKKTQKLIDFDTVLTKHYKIYHWRMDKPVSTYLANVGVSKYKLKSWIFNGLKQKIPVKIYYLPITPDSALTTFKNLNQILKAFEYYFGPYPWNRVGYLQTTMTEGAMEHVTNISLPQHAINGSLKYQDLIAHELSHSWFGDLVTCKSPQDMWLNEGFAEYAASLYKQKLQGTEQFKNSNRERHLYTLAFAQKTDAGYWPIAKIPRKYTYGKTVYNKGADVVHTLRYQIGDSLFWHTIKTYLDSFAYKNISTREFEHFLERQTHQNLKNFFDFWLYTSGFPFFRLYTYDITKINGKYQIALTIEQRTVATDTFLIGQKLQIGFYDAKGNAKYHNTYITGQWTYDTVYLNFRPTAIFIDPNEHVADATIDQTFKITRPENYYFDYEFVQVSVHKAPKPYLLRITTNWLEPDGQFPDNYIVQKNYYWTIKSTRPKHLRASAKFYLTVLMDPNFTNITADQARQNLTMFYRPNPYSPWQKIDSKLSVSGDAVIVEQIKPGDYALALKR